MLLRIAVATALAALGSLAYEQDDCERAADLLTEAVNIQHQLDVVWTKIGGNNDQWTMTLTSQDPNVTISPAGPTDVIFSVDGSGGSQAGGIMAPSRTDCRPARSAT